MYGSEIYNDFKDDIYWIREKILEEANLFSDSLKPLIEYYIKKRLIIIPDKSKPVPENFIDYELGRPVPYAAFWFADAFRFDEKQVSRNLALGLVYSALATTIRDDIMDQESPPDPQCFSLYKYYHHRYLAIFDEIFDPDSKFWYYLATCIREHAQYEKWSLLFNKSLDIDPFSESFLKESSRYFSAVVMPTLSAMAIITNNEVKIKKVSDFLRHFSMGWRIFDDFCDWRKDVKNSNLNHSSILLYILQQNQGKHKLTEEAILSMFLSQKFIEKAYNTIIKYNNLAKEDIRDFNCNYLSKFMEEQISFHTRKRDAMISRARELNSELVRQLKIILEK